jgi:CheY-like chemotaxis protein
VVARDGAEALDFLHCRNGFASRDPGDPAVVLLDLKLPKVDGLEVLEQVKQDPDRRRIPVVMLTSSREERDLVRSYELGVNAFVVKPVNFDEFRGDSGPRHVLGYPQRAAAPAAARELMWRTFPDASPSSFWRTA